MKREYSRIEADGMEASRAAVLFLELIKKHLFQFDREKFNVKIGLGWSVKVPVAIGPDDQISHLDSQEAIFDSRVGKMILTVGFLEFCDFFRMTHVRIPIVKRDFCSEIRFKKG